MAIRKVQDLTNLQLACLAGLILNNPEEAENHQTVMITGIYSNGHNKIYYKIETAIFKGEIGVNQNLTLRLVNSEGEEQPVPNIMDSLKYLTNLIYN